MKRTPLTTNSILLQYRFGFSNNSWGSAPRRLLDLQIIEKERERNFGTFYAGNVLLERRQADNKMWQIFFVFTNASVLSVSVLRVIPNSPGYIHAFAITYDTDKIPRCPSTAVINAYQAAWRLLAWTCCSHQIF